MGSRGRLYTILKKQNSFYTSGNFSFEDIHFFLKKSYQERLKFLEDSNLKYLFLTYGQTNPYLKWEELVRANLTIPIQIYEMCQKLGIHLVIFGSSLETQSIQNPYYQSKREFTSFLKSREFSGVTIFHLHSMYGVVSNPHWSLLGQVELSIRYGSPLNLTTGKQSREFLHWSDFFSQAWDHIDINGIITLSSGIQTTIEEVVTSLHRLFNSRFEFNLGVRQHFDSELMQLDYALMQNNVTLIDKFRDPIEGLITDFRARILT